MSNNDKIPVQTRQLSLGHQFVIGLKPEYVHVYTRFGLYGATMTDANELVLTVKREEGQNYDLWNKLAHEIRTNLPQQNYWISYDDKIIGEWSWPKTEADEAECQPTEPTESTEPAKETPMNSTTRTRTTYTAASLPPLPYITQEVVSAYPMVCAAITKLDNKINEKDDAIMQHQEDPDEGMQAVVALLRLEIEGVRASLWWWLNLQNEIVKRAGLADLIAAHEEGRLSGWEYMKEVSDLYYQLTAGTATLR